MNATATPTTVLYSTGPKDFCLMFFYTIVAIIFHAIIQEYVLDVNIKNI